ncbi:MAG: DUF7344 domain-containing protein [Halapricum sp.]
MSPHDKTDQREVSGGHSRLAEDRFYHALSSAHRRRLLYYLLDAEEATVEELATVLTGWDATETGTLSTPDDRTQHRLALVHIHLPLLDTAGLAAWDRESGTVRLESLEPPVRDIVRRSVESERS